MEFIDFHHLWNLTEKRGKNEANLCVYRSKKQMWTTSSNTSHSLDVLKQLHLKQNIIMFTGLLDCITKNYSRRAAVKAQLVVIYSEPWSSFLFIQGWQYVVCSETWPQIQPFYLHHFLRDAKVVGTAECCKGPAATAVLTKINVPSRGTSLTLAQTASS